MKTAYTLLLSALFGATGLHAQDSTQKETPKATLPGTLRVEVTNGDTVYRGTVLPEAPRRPAVRKPVYKGLIHSGRGFRIQIYSGNDRRQAIQAKARFMRIYPQMRTYLSYSAPQFRVKAGDFQSRNEAYQVARTLTTLFKPIMIVPDVIVVNSLKP